MSSCASSEFEREFTQRSYKFLDRLAYAGWKRLMFWKPLQGVAFGRPPRSARLEYVSDNPSCRCLRRPFKRPLKSFNISIPKQDRFVPLITAPQKETTTQPCVRCSVLHFISSPRLNCHLIWSPLSPRSRDSALLLTLTNRPEQVTADHLLDSVRKQEYSLHSYTPARHRRPKTGSG